jgi:hypothetical protein
MQDSAAGPVHDVCQQDDDQDHDHQPEEEHDDPGDDVPSYSSRSSHGLQLPGVARIIRNGLAGRTARTRRLRASGTGDNKVMGSVADDPATDRPREWLALPGGGIRPVVSVPGPGGIAELLAYGAWLARLRPACRCGKPRLGSGRTCGSAECIAELRVQEPGR